MTRKKDSGDFGIYTTEDCLYDYNNAEDASLNLAEVVDLLMNVWKVPTGLVRKSADRMIALFVKSNPWDERGSLWPTCVHESITKRLAELKYSPSHEWATVYTLESEIMDPNFLKVLIGKLGLDDELRVMLERSKTSEAFSDKMVEEGLRNDKKALISSSYAGFCNWLIKRLLMGYRHESGEVEVILQDPRNDSFRRLAEAEALQIEKARKLRLHRYLALEGYSTDYLLNLLRYTRLQAWAFLALYGFRLMAHPWPISLSLSTKQVTMRGNLVASPETNEVTDATFIRFPSWTQGFINVTHKARSAELKSSLQKEAQQHTRKFDWDKVPTLLDFLSKKEERIESAILGKLDSKLLTTIKKRQIGRATKMLSEIPKQRTEKWFKEDFFTKIRNEQFLVASDLEDLSKILDGKV